MWMVSHLVQESCWLNEETLLTMSTNADLGLTTRDATGRP